MKRLIKIDPLIKAKNLGELLEMPVIIRVKDFESKEAEKFSDQMSDAQSTGQPIIPVVIDSPGGEAYSLLSMISDIENSSLPVATIAIGHAMSAGVVLLCCGTEGHRYADPNAYLMIHEVASGAWGKNEEIKASSIHTDKLNKKIFEMMAKKCGHEKDYFLKLNHEKNHADWYLTPTEAKKHNIINHISVPTYKVNVDVTMKFEK